MVCHLLWKTSSSSHLSAAVCTNKDTLANWRVHASLEARSESTLSKLTLPSPYGIAFVSVLCTYAKELIASSQASGTIGRVLFFSKFSIIINRIFNVEQHRVDELIARYWYKSTTLKNPQSLPLFQEVRSMLCPRVGCRSLKFIK